MRMPKGHDHPCCEEKLEGAGRFFRQEARPRSGEFISVSKSWMGGHEDTGSEALLMGVHEQDVGEWRKLRRRAISLEEKATPFSV